ncbi:MAG: hypothetical protein CME70_11925 [Halobacteriovorax sp.]|nr:hypothetical protein [Halobacteriovorax sp.]
MSQLDFSKLCADSLRNFTKENYNIKLKAAHAHELVAAYFGYNSRNAMISDKRFPIGKLCEAEVIVMISDKEIDARRSELKDLSAEIPDSYTLGEAVYTPLFKDLSLYKSEFPLFRSFERFAKYFVENSQRWKDTIKKLGDFQYEHIVSALEHDDRVVIKVVHTSKVSEVEYIENGETILTLPRIAGKIGFGPLQVKIISKAGGERRVFKKPGGQDV